MTKSVLGAQLYTLRDHLKTPADIASTLARVRKMGYQAVQVSGLGPIETKELARILDGEGLTCAATHRSLDQFKDTQATLEYHGLLKCRYAAIGGFGWNGPSAAEWHAFCTTYGDLARTLAAQGLQLGYHNHSHELARCPDAPALTPMQLLVTECDKAVWFEIDTYWIAHGGGDPAAWIDRVAGRIPCVHLKDMAITADRKQKMCEIGTGNLNWPRILESCRKAQVQWYLIERDDGDLDPFDSLKISFDNLRAMGLH